MTLTQRLEYHASQILKGEFRYLARWVQRFVSARSRSQADVQLAPQEMADESLDEHRVRAIMRVFRQTSMHNYAGPQAKLIAEVVLIIASEQLRAPVKPGLGWQDSTERPLRVHSVATTHLDLLNPPAAAALAAHLDQYLDHPVDVKKTV